MKKARLIHSLSRLLHGDERETPSPDAPLESAEAFSALYERSSLPVYRYLFGLHGGPAQEVEDLLAETYARAWQARRSFHGDPLTAATGWLLRIARRLVIDAYRRSQARIQPDEGAWDDIPAREPAPEALLMADERRQTLWNLLGRLPAEQREMLVLRYLLDWRVVEIGAYLEIPENTVSVTIHRALARLQRDWPGDGTTGERVGGTNGEHVGVHTAGEDAPKKEQENVRK